MKQLALDIGLASLPTLDNFFAGPNEAVVSHLRLWTTGGTRSPVPTYLWGEGGSGKTHLLQAVHHAFKEQGAQVGWLDAHTMNPPLTHFDAQGQARKGVLEADHERAARSLLRQQALVPLRVAPVRTKGQGLQTVVWQAKVWNLTALTVWTRQLASLVRAGLPLERALGALADEADTPARRDLLAQLRSEVNAGSALARAMAEHPREFDTAYRAVVAVVNLAAVGSPAKAL